MKILLSLFTVCCLVLFYGIYLSLFQIQILHEHISTEHPHGYYDYRGVTHVHTATSSGSGTYDEILEYGKASNLDFIIFTDLNQTQKPEDVEGYYQGMLALAGGEYSYLDSRLLYYGGPANNPPEGQIQTQIFFADLLSQGKLSASEFLVLSHPFYARYRWQGEIPPGLRGIEILNLKTILQNSWENRKLTTILSVLIFPFNPTIGFLKILNHPSEELLLWDRLNQKMPSIGFAGNDTNAKIPITGSRFIRFPSYESSFNLISNHILLQSELTGDFSKDREKVLNALFNGQFYMSVDLISSPKGFMAEIQDKQGHTYPMGSQVSLKKGLNLKVSLPQQIKTNFSVRVLKDGEVYATSTSKLTEIEISSEGVYRIEVRVNPKLPLPKGKRLVPWIYSNPFFITK